MLSSCDVYLGRVCQGFQHRSSAAFIIKHVHFKLFNNKCIASKNKNSKKTYSLTALCGNVTNCRQDDYYEYNSIQAGCLQE